MKTGLHSYDGKLGVYVQPFRIYFTDNPKLDFKSAKLSTLPNLNIIPLHNFNEKRFGWIKARKLIHKSQ